jgi:molybdenum ABC transporter molybdate-binding protein
MLPRPRRAARLHGAWLTFLVSAAALGFLVALLAFDHFPGFGKARPRGLFVYCAAGLKKPVEAVAREYQEAYGVEIQLQYGGSNTLLTNLEVSDRGDLYIPADDSYVRRAGDKGLIQEVIPLAHMKPVLAVRKRNPKKVLSLDDLIQRKLRVVQANPQAAAVGKFAQEALTRAGSWKDFEKCIVVTKPTVNDVANDLRIGSGDAGVVWDATVAQFPDLEVVRVPAFEGVKATLSVCVAAKTAQPSEALRFARYLAASDRGLPVFAEDGFSPVEGDHWAEVPELKLYAGAMLRPAIDKTVADFEEREGVKVTRIYNGCGILVAQMKTAKGSPDAYFACDREFLDMVQDRFEAPATISTNQLVILVHKGNPHKIRSLKDLAKPGLRIGVGHEKQCAMGVLTQQALKQDRSHDVVMKNVKVQSPTGDMLVNQLLSRSLDAVIAYISNAAGHAAELDSIAIDIPCAFADQPFAVGKDSRFKHLTGRLLDAIRTEESRDRFTAFGFTWKGSKGNPKPGAPQK